MRKIFTFLILALLCVASATALDITSVAPERTQLCSASPQAFVTARESKVTKIATPRSIEDALGKYSTTCDWLGDTGSGTRDIEISLLDASTGKVQITGWPLDYVIEGTIDKNGTTLVIPNHQFLGMASNGDSIYFYFKEMGSNGRPIKGMSDIKQAGGVITPTAIAFNVNTVWAIGDPNHEENGWFYLGYNMVFEKYLEDWRSIGMATFQDGWILPAFQIDQTDYNNWYQVEMQQDFNHTKRFRIVNPYKGESPVASYNTSEVTGYIQFDVSDPNHVVFEIKDAGFAYAPLGITTLYCYNALTGLSLKLGEDPAKVIAQLGKNIPYTTYKNGVLTLGSIDEPEVGHLEDACIGIQGEIDACLSWQKPSGGLADMATRIFFPGITPDIPDPDKGWTSVGEATFQDGWILPVYGIDQTKEENWYKVELQRNDENPNIFRLVDPYHTEGCPVAKYNKTDKRGHIEFDVTDPEHVTFSFVTAGMAIPELDITNIYCSNTLTHWMTYMDLTANEIVDIFGDTFPYTTFENGVIDMTGFIDDDPTYGILYDACIGTQLNKNAAMRWRSNGVMVNMSTRIIFPDNYNAIDTVSYDTTDAPVEYFNLQGIRVNNPSAGQIIIRRQGNKVEKIFTR